MPDKKYLVIGSSGHQFVDCVDWENNQLPNIVDYDVVIVNVRSITDEFLQKVNNKYFESLRTSLTRLLLSDGTIIILSDKMRGVERKSKYPGYLNNYSWCPIEIGTQSEPGTTIETIENSFPKYFSKFKKWDFYFFIPNSFLSKELTELLGDTNKTQYHVPAKYFIKNRYGKMLSGELEIEVFYKKTGDSGYFSTPYTFFAEQPDKVFGKIILLPLIEDIDHREALNLLLEDLLGKPQSSLPPDWVENVEMPFNKKFNMEIEELIKRIVEYQSHIKGIEEKKGELEQYKKLLYCDGLELENIFRKCLEKLGGKVEPAKYSNEEYCLVFNGKDYPVEAKGVSKSISLTHLRQLIDYTLIYEEKTGVKAKGILLGNPWKNFPLEKRNTKDKPHFPHNVLLRAEELNIALVWSVDFFKAFCRFLEGNLKPDELLSKIVLSKGLVDLSQFY